MESAGFKEWSLVCDALGRGRQSVILRKGGIAEGRGGFSFRHREFFLFPTFFHEQIAKVGLQRLIFQCRAARSQFGGMQEWSGRCGLIHSQSRKHWLRCTSSRPSWCGNVSATKATD